jgi:hypothetical protein
VCVRMRASVHAFQRACLRVRVCECVCARVCVRVCVRAHVSVCVCATCFAYLRCGARNQAAPSERDSPTVHVHCAAATLHSAPSAAGQPPPRTAVCESEGSHHCARVGDRHAVEYELALGHEHRPSVMLHTRGRRCDRYPAEPSMAGAHENAQRRTQRGKGVQRTNKVLNSGRAIVLLVLQT